MLEETTWRAVATGEQPGWEWRARLIAKHIRPGDTVFDFGAGNRKLARFIPSNCPYVPIDAVDSLPGTFVADYNKEFILPDGDFSVAVCAGFLEYIHDVPAFFRNLSSSSPGAGVIFSYMFMPEEANRSSMVLAGGYPTPEALLEAVEPYVSYVCVISAVNNTYIVKAILGEHDSRQDAGDWADLCPIDDIFLSRRKAAVGERLANSAAKRLKYIRSKIEKLIVY